MKFDTPLIGGTLIKRYKRFLADVELDNGRKVTAHTPNTGSMLGCCEPGSRVWLSDSGTIGFQQGLPMERRSIEVRAARLLMVA